jgi:hypothetical protein
MSVARLIVVNTVAYGLPALWLYSVSPGPFWPNWRVVTGCRSVNAEVVSMRERTEVATNFPLRDSVAPARHSYYVLRSHSYNFRQVHSRGSLPWVLKTWGWSSSERFGWGTIDYFPPRQDRRILRESVIFHRTEAPTIDTEFPHGGLVSFVDRRTTLRRTTCDCWPN